MLTISQSPVGRYSGAVLLTLIALAATIQIELIAIQTPFALFFGAVVIAAWYFGRGPAYFAGLLSAAGAYFVLVPYLQSVPANFPRAFQFASFVIAVFFLTWVISSLKRYITSEAQNAASIGPVLEKSPFPVLLVDEASGRILSSNQTATLVYGYTRDEFSGLNISEIVTGSNELLSANAGVGGGSLPINVSQHRCKDGSFIYAELVSQELPGDTKTRLYHAVDVTERLRTSQALKTTEARLEKVFGVCPVSLSVHRWEDRTFVDVNPEFAELTGWALSDIIGKTPIECGLLNDADTEQQLANQLRGRSAMSDYEVEITTRFGKKRTVLVGAIRAEINGEQRVIVSMLDVTELRRAEQRNFDVEKRLRLVTEKARVGLVMINERRRFSFVNGEYAEIFGLPTANIAGHRVAEVHPDLYQNQIEPYLGRAFAGQSLNFELRQSTEDGERFFDVRCEPSSDEDGTQSVVAVVTDITQKTLADLARDASEERYRTLFEYSPDGIAIADSESRYLDANETLCKMLGYTHEEFVGLHATNIFVPREVPHLGQTLFGLNSDLEYYQEWQYRRKDGSTFPGEVVATRMPDGNTLTVIRDITERKHLEDQLLQAQKMEAIGVLAGGVAHDFNNILTAISGYSDLALQHVREEDPIREYISEIGHAGDRAAALTKQLLSFSRRGHMVPSVHSLNDSIVETQRMLKRIVKENINFRIDLAPNLHNIKVDPGHVAQVIVNLVVNAGDAMPDGGTLTIATRNTRLDGDFIHENVVVTSGEFVELRVSDTGIGMDAATQRRLFEPFFTTKETGKGTGLGLSTVYGIVRQSGGDISVTSEIGKGTTFRVYFPIAVEGRCENSVNSLKANLPSGSATVLLVEDEPAVRNLVESILTKQGYDVIAVRCGEEAVDFCRTSERAVDVLLTDMIMPGMNGVTLQREIAAIRPGIRAIIMSGYTGDALENTALDASVSFISKPFVPEDIVRSVSNVLAAENFGLSKTAANAN